MTLIHHSYMYLLADAESHLLSSMTDKLRGNKCRKDDQHSNLEINYAAPCDRSYQLYYVQ